MIAIPGASREPVPWRRLTVPVLILLFGVGAHTAEGTSLLDMLPNSITGLLLSATTLDWVSGLSVLFVSAQQLRRVQAARRSQPSPSVVKIRGHVGDPADADRPHGHRAGRSPT